MTVHKEAGESFLECEDCTTTTDLYDEEQFEAMIRDAKAAGWLIKLEHGEWVHRCPDHKHGDRLAAARSKFGI